MTNIMNVLSVNNQKYPNFGAIKVATARGNLNGNLPKLDIYRLEEQDRVYLSTLKRTVKYKDYFSKFSDELVARWQKIFDYCMNTAISNDNVTYLAFHNRKPCGILTYQNESPIILDGICSIPTDKNKKVPFVGKILFYQLFKDAVKSDSKGIELQAVTDGPYDVIKKYEQLGFKREFTDTEKYVDMYCNKHKVKEQLKEFPFEIDYFESGGEKIDLFDYSALY